MDEADLLADKVAILAAPGKLIAEGSPVHLKSSLGEGYTVQLTLSSTEMSEKVPETRLDTLLEKIQSVTPSACLSSWNAPVASYHLKAKDTAIVEKVLNLVESQGSSLGVVSYDVHGTSMEDVFLLLMKQHGIDHSDHPDIASPVVEKPELIEEAPGLEHRRSDRNVVLANSRRRSPWAQALTIVYKRALIARRSWLTPVSAIVIAVCGACIPIIFLNRRPPTCVTTTAVSDVEDLYVPNQPQFSFIFPGESDLSLILTSPPGLVQSLGSPASQLNTTGISNNATFVQTVQQNFQNDTFLYGGISMDLQTGDSLIAWDASPPGLNGLLLLNLVDNILYTSALNSSGQAADEPAILFAYYSDFPPIMAGTLNALKWTVFFGAVMVCIVSLVSYRFVYIDFCS